MAQALVHAREWVPRWLAQLYEALAQREAQAATLPEKQVYTKARKTLLNHRTRISTDFLQALTRLLQPNDAKALLANAELAGAARPVPARSFDQLELMDHDQVQESVDMARLQQVVKMAAEEDQLVFNARLSRALGSDVVRGEINPLRPERVLAALVEALDGVDVEPAVRALWLNTGAVLLGVELQRLYRSLAELLGRWGVELAGYAVVPTVHARATRASGNSGWKDSVPAADVIGNGSLLSLDDLHRLLKGNLEQGGHKVSDQGVSGSGNAMVKTLATQVVDLLFKRVTEQPQLLASVREQLMGMKPALSQFALNEPRFFAEPDNLVRQLLDRITERCAAFSSEQDAGFSVFADLVRDVARTMQSSSTDLASVFPELLTHLEDKPPPGPLSPSQQTLVRLAQSVRSVEAMVAEMRAFKDFARSPAVVQRFLCGPWSQVVVQARLNAGGEVADIPPEAPASRYMAILPDLLWSTQLALASRNRPRLIKLVPRVLRTLREGLDAIDYPREQAETFFHALLGLQDAAYKSLIEEPPASARKPAAGPAPEVDGMTVTEVFDGDFDAEFGTEEVQDTRPAFSDTQPMPRDEAELKVETPPTDPELVLGAWFDLWHEDQLLRCKLSRVSPHGTVFLFTTGQGRTLSLTRHGVSSLRAHDHLRRVPDPDQEPSPQDEAVRQAWADSLRLA